MDIDVYYYKYKNKISFFKFFYIKTSKFFDRPDRTL